MKNAKKIVELNNKKNQPKNASLLEKVQVVELGKASDLTLGGRHSGDESGNRPRWTNV